MLRIALIQVFFAGILLRGQCQIAPLFSHLITTEEGLSQSTNAYIYQDSYGFVWISSIEGLNRFDGRNIRVFKPDKSSTSLLGRNIQSDFFEDSKGDIWFTTEAGINCYRRGRGDFDQYHLFHNGLSLKNSIHYAFYLERDRFLWVICQNNLFVFDTQHTDTLQSSHYLHPLSGMRCHTIADSEGFVKQILACYWNNPPGGCERIKYDRNRKVTDRKTYPVLSQNLLYFDGITDSQNRSLISTNQGILKISEDDEQDNNLVFYQSPAIHRKITPFIGEKYLAKRGKNDIILFDADQNEFSPFIHTEETLGEAIYLNDNILWYSLEGIGVEYRQLAPVIFSQPIAPQPGGIRTIYSLKDRGVVLLSPSGQTYIHHSDGKISQTSLHKYTKILEDNTDKIWEISEFGLGTRDIQTGYYDALIETGFDFIFYDLAEHGKELLIATNKGLYTFNRETQDFDSLRFVTNDSYILNVMCDHQGRIWTGTGERLDVWERIGKDSLGVIRSYPGNGLINHIVEDTLSDIVWVATSSGLLKIDGHSLDAHLIGTESGLPGLYVNAIVPDTKERIWLSSNQGIYYYYPNQKISRQFTTRNGISSREYHAAAGLKDAEGFIWFGGKQGVDRFHPDSVQEIGQAPALAIVGLHINGEEWKTENQSIETLQNLELKYFQNSLRFDLAAMEFLDPENNKYKVQMEGIDPDWRYLGTQNFVTYSNLNPGFYTFRFTACNAEGIWQNNPQTLNFRIYPHFTQTVWFRLLMLFLALAFVGFITAFYYRYKLNKQQLIAEKQQREAEKRESELQNELKLREQRDRIASDIHDELGTGLSRLRILGDSARKTVEPGKWEQALKNVSEVAEELDNNRRALSWATDPEMDLMSSLLARLRRESAEMFETLNLDYSIDIPVIETDIPVDGRFRLNVLRSVKELLTNIARHAKATNVTLQVELLSSTLKIVLCDNGCGLPPMNNHTGKGMRSIQKRITVLHGKIEWLPNIPQGTKVQMEVPYPIR